MGSRLSSRSFVAHLRVYRRMTAPLERASFAGARLPLCAGDHSYSGDIRMPSYKNDPIIVRTNLPSGPENYNGGIYGESTLFNGVRGVTYAPGHGAVVGISENTSEQGG